MIDEEKIRERVEKRMKERQEFMIHLGIFLAINLFLWLLYFANRSSMSDFPWPFMVTGGWGIGLLAHAIEAYYTAGPGVEARERVIQREIEREKQRLYGDTALEKPKRTARLSDDGELVYDEEDETPARQARDRAG